ncbi:hypothetical protein L195_g041891 [Trifolium pratense]|uniref:Uncharacterized protein n=1 Tax=Trifolium pratense TaxID=57577 RepID=A0A2K3M4V1_TRIPR|nr:hypothetical protein L195_g041891 [Trifolium pratense]
MKGNRRRQGNVEKERSHMEGDGTQVLLRNGYPKAYDPTISFKTCKFDHAAPPAIVTVSQHEIMVIDLRIIRSYAAARDLAILFSSLNSL